MGSDSKNAKGKQIIIYLFLILSLGLYLRISNLGLPSFNRDELNHVFAAKALLEQNKPLLPSNISYKRGIFVSKLISYLFHYFGISEFFARLPSVIFGCLSIFALFILGSWLCNPYVGLTSALFLSLSPQSIFISRFARMYAPLQFFYILLILFFYKGFENNSKKNAAINLIIALFLLYVCISLQIISFTFMPSIAVYVFCMCFLYFWKNGFFKIYKNRYFITMLLILFFGFIISAFRTDQVVKLFDKSQIVLMWAQNNASNIYYYWHRLGDKYSLLLPFLPISLLIALLNYKRRGVYITCLFVVPFLFHSVIFKTKSERFISYFLPILFILFAIMLVFIIKNGYLFLTRSLAEFIKDNRRLRIISISITVLLVMFCLGRDQWVKKGFVIHTIREGFIDGFPHDGWREGGDYLKKNIKDEDIIITASSLSALYYVGRADYNCNEADKRIMVQQSKRKPNILLNKDGCIKDYYGGLIYIKSLDELIEIYKRHKSGWIIYDTLRFKPLSEGIKKFVENTFVRHELPNTSTIRIYSWGRD